MQSNIWKQSLHLEPTKGWLNDPNGLVYFGGNYHIFHQYSYEVDGGLKLWYYYTSKDLINYEDKGVFLKPDKEFDKSGVYSGSANIEGDKVVFYYTGNVKYKGNYDYVHNGRGHNTIKFETKDFSTFSKKELILSTEDYPNMSNHVRDPKIFEKNNNSYLILGARDSNDFGCLLVYKNMEYYKTIYSTKNLGYMWECPDYIEVDGQELLLYSPQGTSNMYPDNKNIYQIGYSIIKEGIENVEKIDNFKILDYGHDFYASQTFIDEDGERVMYAWMYVPDSSYTNPTVHFGYQNCLTIPRVLKFKDGKLYQLIHKSVKKLLGNRIESTNFDLRSWYFKQDNGNSFKITIDSLVIEYDNSKLNIALNESGYGRDNRALEIDIKNIEIVFDNSSFEIFANDGEGSFSSRYYPKNHKTNIRSEKFEAYEFNSINIKQ
ncbi:glycoside hydrolase family 32 protein [Gemella sp. GH3]|uniref:glycoside hydrolase family 32 protein n=1 Tax=unclassified Gemella TaxID=2624949 RepID=UPI0015CFF20C|nr:MULTISPECIES: glycoside hydrolase family 32 protein [unclassified Gemella]MBF0713796.1 glycoside hydrolase family 32 protein [Gemella sp. GH3.1]NYS50748.1 glycoside hydrolase family 32 protein [Gemella sp. GH3]